MDITFRVDSSQQIGFGHLNRCINLAQTLKKNNKITFICKKLNGSNFSIIKKNKFKLKIISNKNRINYFSKFSDANQTIRLIKNKCDLLIVDHYKLGYKWEKQIKKYVKKILVIDDYLNRKHICEFILNSNFAVNKKKYKKNFPKNTKFLLGPKFCILNSAFQKKNSIDQKLKRIFIFLGTDNMNITQKIVKIFNNEKISRYNLDVVLTTKNKNFRTQKKILEKVKNCNIYYNLSNLRNLIAKSQMGLISGGQVIFECINLKLPIIVFQTATNQHSSCKELMKRNLIYFMGRFSNKKNSKYLELIKKITQNNSLRLKLSKNLNNLIDGKGSLRVKKILNV